MENKNEQSEKISSNIEVTEIFTEKDNGYQAAKWFFTYHLKEDETFESAFSRLELLKDMCDKYIWGEEYGKEGNTPHIQGAFILKGKTKMRRDTLINKFFKNHPYMVKLKNWNAGFEYCKKECNTVITNEVIQKPVKTIKRENLYLWQENLLKLIEEEPNDRDIYWYWGKQGVGKTQFIKYLCVHYGAIILNGKPSDMKNGIIDYKNKHNGNTPEIILSNIGFDKDLESIHYSGYEDLKDMCFYSGKYEGGMVVGNNPHLIIFANGKPETKNKKFISREIRDH